MELEQMKSEMQSSENALTQARLAQKSTESELKTVRREQKKVEAELTATILDKQKAEATIFDMVCSLRALVTPTNTKWNEKIGQATSD